MIVAALTLAPALLSAALLGAAAVMLAWAAAVTILWAASA